MSDPTTGNGWFGRFWRHRFWRNLVWAIASVLLVGLIWQFIVVFFHVQSYVAPKPMDALRSISDNWSDIWPLAMGTIRETVYGFAIGAVFGFVLAVVMYKLQFFQKLSYPVIISSQAVPVVALAPIIVLVLGFDLGPKLAVVALIVFFPVTINTLDGLNNVDRDLLSLAKVLGAKKWRTFCFIELPGAVTPMITGLKLGATYAVTGAIIGEQAASTGSSLAIYQQQANASYNIALVYGTTIIMTAIGIAWFLLVVGFGHWATPWKRRSTARRAPWRAKISSTGSTPET